MKSIQFQVIWLADTILSCYPKVRAMGNILYIYIYKA